jgi:hypothetical protein
MTNTRANSAREAPKEDPEYPPGTGHTPGVEETPLDGEPAWDLTDAERELLKEVVQSVRTIPYGTVVLTMHDGRLVEISKTVKLRRTR